MTGLFAQFALVSFLACGKAALPATPLDVVSGPQQVDLRLPLEVQNNGARLVLLVRDSAKLTSASNDVAEAFKAAVPTGSVSAVLTSLDGLELKLIHTDYTFYKGYKGLVLSEAGMPAGDLPQLYSKLKLDAKLNLGNVRIVWLDRAGLKVRDVYPRL